MSKIEEKIKVIILGSRNVYFKTLFYYLLDYQNHSFDIVGVVLREKGQPKNLSWVGKLKEIFRSKGFFRGIYYLLWERRKRFPTTSELTEKYQIPLLEVESINNQAEDFIQGLKPDLGIVCGGGE